MVLSLSPSVAEWSNFLDSDLLQKPLRPLLTARLICASNRVVELNNVLCTSAWPFQSTRLVKCTIPSTWMAPPLSDQEGKSFSDTTRQQANEPNVAASRGAARTLKDRVDAPSSGNLCVLGTR